MKSASPKHHARRKPSSPGAPSNTTPTDWGNVAEWYDQLVGDSGSEYHRQVVLPGVLRLMAMEGGKESGQTAIDVACGQGVLCRVLAERGVRMTGIDASRELIKSARDRGPANIRYEVGDARDLDFLPPANFDAAACVLAVQNINPLQPMFEGVHRVLRAGGRLVIVMTHPAFRGAKETSWGWDDAAKVQYRRVDRYLLPRKTPIVARPGKSADVYTWTFHRPLETYVKHLRNAGLLIDAIEEWPSHKTSTSGPRAAAENRAREEIPLFMAIRAVKIAG